MACTWRVGMPKEQAVGSGLAQLVDLEPTAKSVLPNPWAQGLSRGEQAPQGKCQTIGKTGKGCQLTKSPAAPL